MFRLLLRYLSLTALALGLFLIATPVQGDPRRSPTVRQQRPPAQRARARVKPVRSLRSFRKQFSLQPTVATPFSGAAARRDKLAHGGWNTRKKVRKEIHQAKHSDHGKKHVKARNEVEAKKFSGKAAQYLPGMNNKSLEKAALDKGLWIRRPGGGLWAIFRFDKPVGYDGGEKTRWIRAEVSSGTFHGHPMKLDRVKKYVKNAEE